VATLAPGAERDYKVRMMNRSTTKWGSDVTSDRIAARAYERYVERGCQHGHDVEDWLAAEADLAAERVTTSQKNVRRPSARPATRASKVAKKKR
jgi:hypothetical protein